MKHKITVYVEAVSLMETINDQLEENLISRMDTDFDKTLDEPDHKKRAKLVKLHKRNVSEVSPVCEEIYPHQVRMRQISINLSFLLENACYNKSYDAVARYFAEYDFLSQTITKEVKKVKNDVLVDFLERCTVLNENYFQVLMTTLETLKYNVIARMTNHPEIYIDLNVEEDSRLDFDTIKDVYKSQLKKLKEDHKKQKKQAVENNV